MNGGPQRLSQILPGVVRDIASRQTSPLRGSALPRVYLAGKIRHTDWRHQVVPNLRNAWGQDVSNGMDLHHLTPWPVLAGGVLNGRADYVGPYFVGCDHGCTHGERTHATSGGCTQPGDHLGRWEMRDWVFDQCRSAVLRADWVVAHIDSPDCFGTLFELGWASALGKKIAISFALDQDIQDDMWFIESAETQATLIDDPVKLVESLFPIPSPPVKVDSEAERRVWEAHERISLPELVGLITQHPVLRYRLDFALPERQIGFEIDGYAYHSDRESFERDRKRHRELELAGWRVIRFSGKEACDEPEQVVRDMARAVAAFSVPTQPPAPAVESREREPLQ